MQVGSTFSGGSELEHLSCAQTLCRVWFHCYIFQELFARSVLNEAMTSQWRRPSANTELCSVKS